MFLCKKRCALVGTSLGSMLVAGHVVLHSIMYNGHKYDFPYAFSSFLACYNVHYIYIKPIGYECNAITFDKTALFIDIYLGLWW